MDAREIHFARSGSGTSSYDLHNVETPDADIGGGGGGDSIIPELSTISMFILAVGFSSCDMSHTKNHPMR